MQQLSYQEQTRIARTAGWALLSSIANAGFFHLFLKSRQIPLVIAGWGLFASPFVALTVVARDFVSLLAHDMITLSFMVSNLVAMVATGGYLGIKGVRQPPTVAGVSHG